jgi:urease accessory protein
LNLRLLQLGDSALPIGGYSHSWGLEAAVDCGLVRDAAGLEDWVRSWARLAVAPSEGVVVGYICRAAARHDLTALDSANELMQASLTPTTLRHASRDLGGQLLALAECWPWAAGQVQLLRQIAAVADWHHAVVFGALAAAAGSTAVEAVAVYLHQAVLGVIGAGVRAIPMGHTHGQQLLARLHPDLEMLAAEVAERELETAGSFCPAYEVFCHAQSRLYTRLFRS